MLRSMREWGPVRVACASRSMRTMRALALGRSSTFLVALVLGLLVRQAAAQSVDEAQVRKQGTCTLPGNCVIHDHPQYKSWNNSEPFMTAVGCEKTFSVVFGNLPDSTVRGVEETPEITAWTYTEDGGYAGGEILSALVTGNPLADRLKTCCPMHPIDKEALVAQAGDGGALCDSEIVGDLDHFRCMTMKQTLMPGYTVIDVTFIAPYKSDVVFEGKTRVCMRKKHEVQTSQGLEEVYTETYCVEIQVQRCSACVKEGESLASLAKTYGSHWSQIYSANHDIPSSPDSVIFNQMVRLGPLYAARTGDTLLSIALKFGVTVNQLFFWNQHLRDAENSNPDSPNAMSRALELGQLLCVLPRTCYNTFGKSQPAYLQSEVDRAEGGWFGIKDQTTQ